MKTVIMAGGKGTRIQSVASDIPKPMIKINKIPVLEREILSLRDQGFKDLIITVSHELIPEDVFENYCIIVVEDDDEKKLIGGYDLNLFLQKYSNVFEVKGMFEEVLFELLKHYYIDDRFFHIDKFVIAADNAKTANLLRDILPEYNYEERHPDVFLIRSMVESQMPGGLRYAVSDIFVAALMKLSMDDMGLLESIAYGDFEIPEDISKLPFNC